MAAKTWTLAQIRAKVREMTGRPDTNQISDSDLNDLINSYYVNVFPMEIGLPDEEGFYSFTTTASDGEYDVPESVIAIGPPFTIDDGDGDLVDPLALITNRADFFGIYPEDDSADDAQPIHIGMFGEVFYLRPIPDDTYTAKMWATRRPVTELTSDSSVPSQTNWGPAIASGTAREIKATIDRDMDGVAEIAVIHDYNLLMITRKEILRLSGQRSVPRF